MAYIAANCADCSSGTPCGCCPIVVVADNVGGPVDFSGTYTQDGTYEDSEGVDWPKFVRTSPSTAYIYRDTWWTIAQVLGESDPGYTQIETTAEGDDCPTDTYTFGGIEEGIWFVEDARDLTVVCA